MVVGVEHLPEGRAEDTLSVEDRHTEGISITDLVGIVVYTDLPADQLDTDEPGNQGALDHIEMLGKTAKGNVHILIRLGKNIHRHTTMTVILEPLNGIHGKGFILTAVKVNTGLVNDQLAIINGVFTDIMFTIYLIGTFDRDIGENTNRALPMGTGQNPGRQAARETTTQADHNTFMLRPTGKIGGKGSFTGARNAKIHIELERMPRVIGTLKTAPKNKQKEGHQISHTKKLLLKVHGQTQEGRGGFFTPPPPLLRYTNRRRNIAIATPRKPKTTPIKRIGWTAKAAAR